MIPITRAAIAIPLVLSLGGVAGTAGTAGTAVYVVDMIFTYGIFFHTNITLEKRGVEGEWNESGRKMEGEWKEDGRRVEGGRWKEDGRKMEGEWKESGRRVEGEWKESGSEGCAHSSEAIEDGIIFTFLSLILEKVSEIS